MDVHDVGGKLLNRAVDAVRQPAKRPVGLLGLAVAAERQAVEPAAHRAGDPVEPMRRLGDRRIAAVLPADQHARVNVPPRQCLVQPVRSEEHTSELQSLMRISYAVFCLKKKKYKTKKQPTPQIIIRTLHLIVD